MNNQENEYVTAHFAKVEIDAANRRGMREADRLRGIITETERERDEARDQLYRISLDGFGMRDTIGGEACVDYVLRQLADMRNRMDIAVAALKEIAAQKLREEMDDHTGEHADYEDGYEACVKAARRGLDSENY